MRNVEKMRKVVTWVSVTIAVLSFVLWLYSRLVLHHGMPWWDKVLLAYGGVFCVFLFFDEIGRTFSKLRKEKSAEVYRPRPVRPTRAGHQVVAASTPTLTVGQIRLQRVSASHAGDFRQFVADFYTETLALDGTKPDVNEDGDVEGVPVRDWLSQGTYHPFLIMVHDTPAGCCVLQTSSAIQKLLVFYIDPSYRRRCAGSSAMQKMDEFIRLTGTGEAVVAKVSVSNMRGQHFLRACGYQLVSGENPEDAGGQVAYSKSLSEE